MSDPQHGIRMIDVGGKPVTVRTARASARLTAGSETIRRIRGGELEMAAKKTSEFVPLCHPLPLEAVEVAISFPDAVTVAIETRVRTTARTGVEMEALTAATAAALAIYDMCKSIDPDMAVERVQLEEKTGGIHGDYRRSAGP